MSNHVGSGGWSSLIAVLHCSIAIASAPNASSVLIMPKAIAMMISGSRIVILSGRRFCIDIRRVDWDGREGLLTLVYSHMICFEVSMNLPLSIECSPCHTHLSNNNNTSSITIDYTINRCIEGKC